MRTSLPTVAATRQKAGTWAAAAGGPAGKVNGPAETEVADVILTPGIGCDARLSQGCCAQEGQAAKSIDNAKKVRREVMFCSRYRLSLRDSKNIKNAVSHVDGRDLFPELALEPIARSN